MGGIRMNIETEIEIKFKTTLGDSFSEGTDTETINTLIEEHIQDFCKEHRINRINVKITNKEELDGIMKELRKSA